MADFASEVQRPSSGCGVQGCLFAAVALFVLLLVGLLVIGVFRFSQPPQGAPRPPVGMVSAVGHPSSVVGRPSPVSRSLPPPPRAGPRTDDRRPTTGRERRGWAHG